MKWILATLLVVAAVATGQQYYPNGMPVYDLNKAYDIFQKYIRDYNRHYMNTTEWFTHFEVFKKNLAKLNQQNSVSPPGGMKFGISLYSDLRDEELPIY